MDNRETMDVRLVEMTRAGDNAAFDTLVRKYQRAVHAIAFATLSDRDAALDVLQDTFFSAYRQINSLNDPSKFGPWVCAIARYTAKRAYRDRLRLRNREACLAADHPSAIFSYPNSHAESLREALSKLTEAQSDVVTLFYMEGYSISECAHLLETPEGTVKRRLYDARRKLKKEMTDMTPERLSEFALPENYRVAIDLPSRIHTTTPALARFKDKWVLIWQDGEPWEPYDGPFWFWLSESADGMKWSEPRRLDIAPQWQSQPALVVAGDELFLHTHHHHYGLRLHRSVDLQRWTECPPIRLSNVGRSGLFTNVGQIFIAYPTWRPHEAGDVVEVMRSNDSGSSWTWLNPPFASSGGVTDAAGIALDNKLFVAWRGHAYPAGATNPNEVWIASSEDHGSTWSEPTKVEPLSTMSGSFSLKLLQAPESALVIVQDVRADISSGSGEIWVLISRDGGRTWEEKGVYSAGMVDPAVAFSPDGVLMIAGSLRSGDESRPWIVHSRVDG